MTKLTMDNNREKADSQSAGKNYISMQKEKVVLLLPTTYLANFRPHVKGKTIKLLEANIILIFSR